MDIVWFILIGLVAGWLAGQFVKGSGFGIVGDVVLGIVGAVLGGLVFRLFGLTGSGSIIGSLVVATLGAVVLLYVLHWFDRHRHA